MNRSDSTTLPSGISMRTGPCTITGPEARPARCGTRDRSWFVRPDHQELLFTPTGLEAAGLLQPFRSRCQHGSKRNPLVSNNFSIQPGAGQRRERLTRSGELGLHDQQRSAAGEQPRRRRTQRVKDKTTVVSGIPRPCGSDVGRQLRGVDAGVMGHVRRIADHQVVRAELDRPRP